MLSIIARCVSIDDDNFYLVDILNNKFYELTRKSVFTMDLSLCADYVVDVSLFTINRDILVLPKDCDIGTFCSPLDTSDIYFINLNSVPLQLRIAFLDVCLGTHETNILPELSFYFDKCHFVDLIQRNLLFEGTKNKSKIDCSIRLPVETSRRLLKSLATVRHGVESKKNVRVMYKNVDESIGVRYETISHSIYVNYRKVFGEVLGHNFWWNFRIPGKRSGLWKLFFVGVVSLEWLS